MEASDKIETIIADSIHSDDTNDPGTSVKTSDESSSGLNSDLPTSSPSPAFCKSDDITSNNQNVSVPLCDFKIESNADSSVDRNADDDIIRENSASPSDDLNNCDTQEIPEKPIHPDNQSSDTYDDKSNEGEDDLNNNDLDNEGVEVGEEVDEDDPDDNDDDDDVDGGDDNYSGYNAEEEIKTEGNDAINSVMESSEQNDDRNTGETEIDTLLKKRMQPLMELVYSEQSYVSRLKIIKEKYMPLPDEGKVDIPEDLSNKWRILWGNWIQLHEWHTSFVEKLERLVKDDPDQIPKLFIDSRARLRNIYSKYCENHRKAALIAEQYKDFFDSVRVVVSDREDVVSHLMQPVQRIMRYQLPMGEIVKYTDRADLPSKPQWHKALEIMKEIPKDTQLILEAARIDGFPGVITSLGNIRIRGELLIATTSKAEMQQPSFTQNDLKFMERRVFLFDQMLLVTEESKPKKKDAFAQSTYQFKYALNVNRMKFESHWFGAEEHDDDLKFTIQDDAPGKDAVFICDPESVTKREHWVIQLRDLQNMQQDLLLALQNPKQFVPGGSSGAGGGMEGMAFSMPPKSGAHAKSCSVKGSHPSTNRTNSDNSSAATTKKQKKQKWPSFSKKAHHRSRTEELPTKQCSAGQPHRPLSTTQQSGSTSTERLEAANNNQSQECPSGQSEVSAMKHEVRKNSSANQTPPRGGEDSAGPSAVADKQIDKSGKKKSIFSWFAKNKSS